MILPRRQADSQGVTSGEFVSGMAKLCERHEQGSAQTRHSGCFLLVAASRLTASCFDPSGSAAADWVVSQAEVNVDLLGDGDRVSVDFLTATHRLMDSFGSVTRLQFAAALALLCASWTDLLTPFDGILCG